MSVHRLGRGACEYLPHLKLLLSYWPNPEFLDEEWDAYVSEIRRHSHAIKGFRVLTWNSRNATPIAAQQMRMSNVVAGNPHPVSIVMQEKPHGFATAVLALVNRDIRSFSQDEWPAACTHLGLTAAEQREAELTLERLRQAVDVSSARDQ